MKVIMALLLLVSAYGVSQAQFYYKNSAGARVGYTTAATYKHFITEEQAMELMVSNRNNGLQFTHLYLFHRPIAIGFNDDFYFFYGVGGHIGFESFLDQKLAEQSFPLSNSPIREFDTEERSFFTMGVNTTIGMEYRLLKLPATIGIDIKPYLDFIGMRRTKMRFWDTALTLKYIF
ncbi:hypothetical protein FNH22_27200 [Fulvivirga sp. M361]|uniref:hypothetical protein n=1 Tax=Fulvivirga sp. M361 TaxID=2594266 RepID=UPI0011799991|nr:hypothetical protein [Fulvivirga sp. M361]TRX49316.1 hypothetical protein FNH22_27200 [Fulvivirga sp. M361]